MLVTWEYPVRPRPNRARSTVAPRAFGDDPGAVRELGHELAGLGIAGVNIEDGRENRALVDPVPERCAAPAWSPHRATDPGTVEAKAGFEPTYKALQASA